MFDHKSQTYSQKEAKNEIHEKKGFFCILVPGLMISPGFVLIRSCLPSR